jgi:hypothetical protein
MQDERDGSDVHTDQSKLVRASLEATAHPDVYAKRTEPLLPRVGYAVEFDPLKGVEDVPCDGGFACRAVYHLQGCFTGSGHPDAAVARGVSENRLSWRAWLAHVEVLLTEAMGENFGVASSVAAADDGQVAQALAEVRAMIDAMSDGE